MQMRYMTGSRSLMLPDAMSILARSTRAPIGKLSGAHAPEEIEVLFDRSIAYGLFSRLGQRAARGAHLLQGLLVDVGLSVFDQFHREL